jgi:LDH2 family malate/lactate/ureidoglycolate dehydrogenase
METKPSETTVRVPVDRLRAIYAAVARAHGADGDEQAIFADCLLRADFRGHPTQGVGLLAYLDELFEGGTMHFGGRLSILSESASAAALDGGGNSGHLNATRAMRMAIAKAKETGIGYVTVRNTGDCGMAANYSVQAVEAGLVGIAMATGPVLVAPWGGREAQFCTNPISLAVPAGAREPIVIDMATSAESMGSTVLAARDKRRLSGLHVVTADGEYTDDAGRVILDALDRESKMAGALLPAGPKGFGMVLMVELLSALMSGERWGPEGAETVAGADRADKKRGRSAHYAHALIAISVEHFMPRARFLAAVDRMVETLVSSPPAKGFDAVRLPGQGTRAREADYRAKGVPVRPEEWAQVERVVLARRIAVP